MYVILTYLDCFSTAQNRKEEKMKETLEKLWNDYLLNECAAMNTEEERALTRKAVTLRKKATASLSAEQKEAVDAYVNVLYCMESLFVKKAFFAGCEFSVSFLLEAGNLKK